MEMKSFEFEIPKYRNEEDGLSVPIFSAASVAPVRAGSSGTAENYSKSYFRQTSII